jgi:hypothetical protein
MASTRIIPALGVALGVIGSTSGGTEAVRNEDIASLIRRSAEGNAALVRGDLDGYLAHIDPAEDFVLMPPYGGPTRHGFDRSDEYRASTAKFFRGLGTFDQEVVATYGSDSLVVLVTIERVRGEIGGLPNRTMRCASPRSIVATGTNGTSCIATRIRWQTASRWNTWRK